MSDTRTTIGTRHEIGDAFYIEMLRLRRKIFGDRLKWSIPSTSTNPELEEDAFDTPHTIYILIGSPIVACCRLIPTTRTTMISKIWPDVLAGVSDNTSWELSRFAADKDARMYGLLAAKLLLTAYEFALTRSIRRYIVISTPAAAKIIRRMGVQTELLPSRDTSIVASSTTITSEVGSLLQTLVGMYENRASGASNLA